MRVVCISYRYWPLAGDEETALADLAGALVRRGGAVTVLTVRWERAWPETIIRGGVRVVRLPAPAGGALGRWRLLGRIGGWLAEHAREFDGACVSGLRGAAYAAVGALAAAMPVVLRAERAGPEGDCAWQRRSPLGGAAAARCRLADAILAPSAAIEQELLAQGYGRDRVRLLRHGAPDWPPREPRLRRQARGALAEAHPLLGLGEETPLAVYVGPFRESCGVLDLVAAWERIAARLPQARLWLVGDGPQARPCWRKIRQLDLERSALMIGSFDDVQEPLFAADAVVFPSRAEGSPARLGQAAAAGAPLVAADLPGLRAELAALEGWSPAPVRFTPPGDVPALARALAQCLRPPEGETAAPAAPSGPAADGRLDAVAQAYLDLFVELRAWRGREAS